jgi:glyoxylase-like metal-dependent hydrolase (beta-lactamase superfamily II)
MALKKHLLTVCALLLLIGNVAAQNSNNKIISQAGYYKTQVGEAEVIALSDGTAQLKMDDLLFNAKPGEIKKSLEEHFLTTTVETSINAFLIKLNGKLILIDAGCGAFFGPTAGKLQQSLKNACYTPDQIDMVLITHLHVDHVGGLIQDEKMVFPNATLFINSKDAAFWLSEENEKKAAQADKFFFDAAQKSVSPYVKAGKVKLFDKDTVITAGLETVAAYGHTPGHTTFILKSNGDKILFLGDLIHSAEVQFTDPAVTIHFDVNAPEAAKARRTAFNDAVQGKYKVAFSHLSFPAIGHLKASGNGYLWLPSGYSTIASN